MIGQSAGVLLVLGVAVVAANLPFVTEPADRRPAPRGKKALAWRLLELLLLSAATRDARRMDRVAHRAAAGAGLGVLRRAGLHFLTFAFRASSGATCAGAARRPGRLSHDDATDAPLPGAGPYCRPATARAGLSGDAGLSRPLPRRAPGAVRLPTARPAHREYIVTLGRMIVPLLDDGRLVVRRHIAIRSRAGDARFPAGKLEPGEPPFACAVRELAEETGYRARSGRAPASCTTRSRIRPRASRSGFRRG